ncbi:MAG TPA: cupin domain-containing protein [Acidimicrobiia bacterium]|nr:cupin domain-containing protein [Acidimicrobiia bacterium]
MTLPNEVARLIEYAKQDVVARGDGIESVRLTPQPLAGQGFSMGITSFPPGASIRLHSHNTIEQVTVVEGAGVAVIQGEELPARPYDTTQIPAGAFHRFVNTGDTWMRILWVYGSTHVTRTFADTGETVDQFDS